MGWHRPMAFSAAVKRPGSPWFRGISINCRCRDNWAGVSAGRSRVRLETPACNTRSAPVLQDKCPFCAGGYWLRALRHGRDGMESGFARMDGVRPGHADGGERVRAGRRRWPPSPYICIAIGDCQNARVAPHSRSSALWPRSLRRFPATLSHPPCRHSPPDREKAGSSIRCPPWPASFRPSTGCRCPFASFWSRSCAIATA